MVPYINKSKKTNPVWLQKNEIGEIILARTTVKIKELSRFSKWIDWQVSSNLMYRRRTLKSVYLVRKPNRISELEAIFPVDNGCYLFRWKTESLWGKKEVSYALQGWHRRLQWLCTLFTPPALCQSSIGQVKVRGGAFCGTLQTRDPTTLLLCLETSSRSETETVSRRSPVAQSCVAFVCVHSVLLRSLQTQLLVRRHFILKRFFLSSWKWDPSWE